MSENGNASSSEIRLKLKHGSWEVEIACSEDKVKDVVEKVLSTIDSVSPPLDSSNVAENIKQIRNDLDSLRAAVTQIPRASDISPELAQNPPRSNMTCRGLVESLWNEGYLAEERPLSEVHEELSRRGYNYDKTAVAHALADMVREGYLSRLGTMRNFRYIQKRPPMNSISDQTA